MPLLLKRTNDFWLDNGITNLYALLKQIPEKCVHVTIDEESVTIDIRDQRKFFEYLKQSIITQRDRIIFCSIQDKRGLKRNITPKYILLQYGKKVKGKNVVKEKLYDDKNGMDDRVEEAFTANDDTGSGKTCALCGSAYKKNVDKIKQSVYPLATKNAALSGVREKKDYYDNMCPLCYLIGCLEWTDESVMYRSGLDEQSIVLYPESKGLASLARFKSLCRDFLKERDPTSNLRMKGESWDSSYAAGEYSLVLLFIEKMFETIKAGGSSGSSPLASDNWLLQKNIWPNWVMLRIPAGTVKNIKVDRLTIPVQAAVIVHTLMSDSRPRVNEDDKIYSSIISKFYLRITDGKKITFEQRNKLARNMHETMSKSFLKNDFHLFAGVFLPRKGIYVSGPLPKIDKLLSEWQVKHIDLSNNDVEEIKKAANIIAETSLNNIGLLYKLDRAQTISEFINGIKEAARKLAGGVEEISEGKIRVSPTSLDSLMQLLLSKESKFKEIRDIIVIYACLYFTIKKTKTASGHSTSQETKQN